jgi:lysophospholipase L1-like esterase
MDSNLAISTNAPMNKHFFWRPPFIVTVTFIILYVVLDAGLATIVVEHEPHSPNIYYHHGLKPNLSVKTRWGRDEYQLFTDDLGLKDWSPRQVPREDRHRRILFLGDSFVEGLGVPYENTFVGVVRDRIRQRSDGTEVFNGGCLSHSPRLYLLHLQDLVDRLGMQVDEVVVFIDISDIEDELIYEDFTPGKVTSTFVIRKLMYFFREHSLLGYVIFTHARKLQHYLEAVKSWMGAHVHQELSPRTSSQTPVRSTLSRSDRTVPEGGNYYTSRGAWVSNDEAFRAWGERGLRLARENLHQLVEYAHGKGMDVSFAVYPWPRFTQTPGRARDVWRKMAAEENWTLVDLFEDFAAAPDSAARLFIRGDIHWNALGHQFVAEHWMAHYCAMRQSTWCEPRVDPKYEDAAPRLQ